jgi:hypothetical protein
MGQVSVEKPVAPGSVLSGNQQSKHGVSAGNVAALLTRLSELKQKALARTGKSFHVVVIQEAGLDGFAGSIRLTLVRLRM